MEDTSLSVPDSKSAANERAIRFGFAAVVVGMSYPNIRLALSIEKFAAIFHDMLNGKPLPPATRFALGAEPELIALSILIPISALALVFIGRLTQSVYLSGACVLMIFVQLYFTWEAMSAPLFEIMKAMGGAGA